MPVDMALIVAHVNAANFIAFGYASIVVDRLPYLGIRFYEKEKQHAPANEQRIEHRSFPNAYLALVVNGRDMQAWGID